MLRCASLFSVLVLAGCELEVPTNSVGAAAQTSADESTQTAADPLDPATFADWPAVTDRPVPVGQQFWALCVSPSPLPAEIERHGPHVGYSIVVRVSPEAEAAFRAGGPLPVGAVVIKEKHADPSARDGLYAFAAMIKQHRGYDPAGGDWEYAYATFFRERKLTRGRLAECAGCHAKVEDQDFLYRSYVTSIRE